MYLNGEEVASGSVADKVMTQTGAKVYFGVNGWDAYFKGAVDEIMCFDRVLSDDEIASIQSGNTTASNVTSQSNNGNNNNNNYSYDKENFYL